MDPTKIEKQLKVPAASEGRSEETAGFSQTQQLIQGDNHDQNFQSEGQQFPFNLFSKRVDSSEESTLFQSADTDIRMLQPSQTLKGSSSLTPEQKEAKKIREKLRKRLKRKRKRIEMAKQRQAASNATINASPVSEPTTQHFSKISDHHICPSLMGHLTTSVSRSTIDHIGMKEKEIHTLANSAAQHDKDNGFALRNSNHDTIGERKEEAHPHAFFSSRDRKEYEFSLRTSPQAYSKTNTTRSIVDPIQVREEDHLDASSFYHHRRDHEFTRRTSPQSYSRTNTTRSTVDPIRVREEDVHLHASSSHRHRRDHESTSRTSPQSYSRTNTTKSTVDPIRVREGDVHLHASSSHRYRRDHESTSRTSWQKYSRANTNSSNVGPIRVREEDVHHHASSSYRYRRAQESTPRTSPQKSLRANTTRSTNDLIRSSEKEFFSNAGGSYPHRRDQGLTSKTSPQTHQRSTATPDMNRGREEVHSHSSTFSLPEKDLRFAPSTSTSRSNLDTIRVNEEEVYCHADFSSRNQRDREFNSRTTPKICQKANTSRSTVDPIRGREEEVYLHAGSSYQTRRDHEFILSTSPQPHLKIDTTRTTLDSSGVREKVIHSYAGFLSQHDKDYELLPNPYYQAHQGTGASRGTQNPNQERDKDVHSHGVFFSQHDKDYRFTPNTSSQTQPSISASRSTFDPYQVRKEEVYSYIGSSSHEKDHKLDLRTSSVPDTHKRKNPNHDFNPQKIAQKESLYPADPSNKRSALQKPGKSQTQKETTGIKKRALQVVIMGSEEGAPITQEEAQLIRKLLIEEIEMRINEPRPRRMPLVFENSGHQTEPGWFLITCSNEETRDWLLNWVPPTERKFVVRRSKIAPWPSKIVIGLGAENIEPERLLQFLEYQNDGLTDVDQWRFLGNEGEPVHRRAIFRVPSSTIAWLEAHDWRIRFELVKLSVWRAPPSTSRPSSSAQKGSWGSRRH